MKTRIIKQEVNSKGKITKTSRVVKEWKYYPDGTREPRLVEITKYPSCKCKNTEIGGKHYVWMNPREITTRNLIIFILILVIINLLSWR